MAHATRTSSPSRQGGAELAEDVLRIILSAGPRRALDVRALAGEAGLTIDDAEWRRARRRLGVQEVRRGDEWYWSLPAMDALLEAFAAWLDTPAGRFAAYLAERDRLADTTAGEQLRLV
jgi:hypothetical protein